MRGTSTRISRRALQSCWSSRRMLNWNPFTFRLILSMVPKGSSKNLRIFLTIFCKKGDEVVTFSSYLNFNEQLGGVVVWNDGVVRHPFV